MSVRAWLPSANAPGTDFPIANLPYGAFAAIGEVHLGVAIGDQILDLYAADQSGLLNSLPERLRAAYRQPQLNALMALDPALAQQLRLRLMHLLSTASAEEQRQVRSVLAPQAGARLHLPVAVGDYTDFYASLNHATNVGLLFRPDSPLMPNYKYVPVGYHGRSSSLDVSPQAVRRPNGQRPGRDGGPPDFGPCRQLDYELELGIFVGTGNVLGNAIPMTAAEEHIFGFCLLNDWSARDIQRWEYQPLGPFLGKSFATTLSPWVVPLAALASYRVPRAARPSGDPDPLPYLESEQDRSAGGVNVTLEVWLTTAAMRTAGTPPLRLSRSCASDLYWTPAQLLTHHASNGCNLRPGDLFGTGTISGPQAEARGCLLELTRAGREPVTLPGGETRGFLHDGDEVTFHAFCEASGQPRIGFGECRGRIEPALSL
ncbi:MAG: fumarylacetoacetase [Terriglobales bacterium]